MLFPPLFRTPPCKRSAVLWAFNMLTDTFIHSIIQSCFHNLKRLFGQSYFKRDSVTRRKSVLLQMSLLLCHMDHGETWLGEALGGLNQNTSAHVLRYSLASYFQTIKDSNSRFKLWWFQLLSNRFSKLRWFQLWNWDSYWDLGNKWCFNLANFVISLP